MAPKASCCDVLSPDEATDFSNLGVISESSFSQGCREEPNFKQSWTQDRSMERGRKLREWVGKLEKDSKRGFYGTKSQRKWKQHQKY